MTAIAKRTKRKIQSRKLRSKRVVKANGDDLLPDVQRAARIVQAMMPQTASVLSAALETAGKVVDHVAVEQLSKVDARLAEQLMGVLAKKRST